MGKQNFSVKAIIRNDKKRKDGRCPINYRVTINSTVLKLSSGLYVEESNWNIKDGIFKESKSSYNNCMLDKDKSNLLDFLREKRSIGVYLDKELIKSFHSTNDKDDFYEYFDKFCEKKFTTLSEGTIYHYKLLRNRLKEFKKEIRFSEINTNFIERFDSFLKVKCKTGKSGRWGRHKNLKVVLISALKLNLINSNPYNEFKIVPDDVKLEYLTDSELKLIEKLSFSNFPKGNGLSITRDLFLFSCYTGLRYSDVNEITHKDILNLELISLRMKKTKKIVQVPLTIKAKLILKKYVSKDADLIFPYRCNVAINRDLKIIGSLCKINKKLHFHLGRHTFASTMANSNINAFHIMRLLGHSNIATTQRYVNNSIEDLSSMLKEIKTFN